MDAATTFERLTTAIGEVVRVAREYRRRRESEVDQGVGGGADWWNENQNEAFGRMKTARSLILNLSDSDVQQIPATELIRALDQLEFTWSTAGWLAPWDDDALRRYRLIVRQLFDQTIGAASVRDFFEHRQGGKAPPDPAELDDPIGNSNIAKLAGYEGGEYMAKQIRAALKAAGRAVLPPQPGPGLEWAHSQLRAALPHLPPRSRLKKFLLRRGF